MGIIYTALFWVVVIVFFTMIRQVNQYERGVKFMFGKFHKLVDPGWRIVVPVIQSMTKVDIRIKAVEVPYQDAITKDNVSCKVNAVIYYRIIDAGRSLIEVENVWNAVSQLAQTTMRNICGELTLDELLSERDQASMRIKELLATHAATWGIEVQGVELKDIALPEDMKRTIGKQAEAEREKRSVIISSEGEVIAADNLSKAATILASSPGALHLRTLNTINDVSSDESNTILFALPIEVLKAFDTWSKK